MVKKANILLAAVFGLTIAVTADAADLGKNLAGETCGLSGDVAIGQPASISCGGSGDVAGQLSVIALEQSIPADPVGRRATLEQMLSMSSSEAICGNSQWFGRLLLRVCTLKANGWPRILIGMETNAGFYQANGIPSSLPVLEAAIAVQSHVTIALADAAAVANGVRAELSSGVVKASGEDYSRYKSSIEMARLAAAADNYAAAETGYRDALNIEERLFGSDSVIVGETLAELALQVSNQGRFAEAASLFQRAGPIVEASSDNDLHARFDSYSALDAANQRHYADALKFARQATAARRLEIAARTKQNVSSDPSGAVASLISQGELAHDLRVQAEMALRVGDTASAQAAAEESLWIVSEEPGLPLWWRSDTVALMGEINEQLGRVVTAEHDFRDARDLDTKIFGDTAPAALSNLRLAEFYTRQQVYGPALDAYKLAFDIATNDPITRRQIYPDDVVQYVTAAAGGKDIASADSRDADIFRISQFASNGVADQTIARVASRQAAGSTALAGLIAQLHQAMTDRDRARVDLAAEMARPNDERNSDLEESLNAKLKLASASADSLATQVRQSFPQYANLAEPGPSDLVAVQSAMAPDSAMLFFVIGENSSYALVVRHDGFSAIPLAIGRDALTGDVSDLRRAFVPALGRVPDYSLKNAYELYRVLFAPIEPHLSGISHLVVVPGGPLASFPLSLLVSEDPGDGHNYAQAAWLVKRFAITVTPSPRAYLSLKEETAHHAPASRAFLGIGAPSFQGPTGVAGAKALADLSSGCRQAGPVSPDLLRALPPLPGTAAEVQTIGSRLGGGNATILLGAQATEANLRAQPLDQYAVVYFATHGILPGQMHCESEPALALSPPAAAAATTASDGMLTASEIADFHLNADLVVLSACNTAEAADGLGGGALDGLSDAFFAAGARAVLASHWEVPSVATATLMTGIFDRTNRVRGIAEALRQSQLSLISRPSTAHPFNWAAFTVIGDGQAHSGDEERSAQLTNAGHP